MCLSASKACLPDPGESAPFVSLLCTENRGLARPYKKQLQQEYEKNGIDISWGLIRGKEKRKS